jgi:hypothetical protein
MKRLFNLDRVDLQVGVVDTTAAVGDVNGSAIDSLNYNSGIALFNLVNTTVQTDYSIKLQHKDAEADDWADVDTDLVALVTGSITDSEATEKIEIPFNSLKRYVRVVATLAANAADSAVIAYALGDKDYVASATDFLDN